MQFSVLHPDHTGRKTTDRLIRSTTSMFLAAALVSTLAVPARAQTVLHWAGCGISKNAFMKEMAAAYEKKTGIKIDLVGGGATKGIREVSSHEVEMGGTCRETIEDPGTLMGNPHERMVQLTPVAWDALVVIVHKDNPVQNVTLDQVRQIYLGQITNWKQLGGKDAPVELYVRKGKISGVGRTLREIVFHNYDQEFRAKYVVDSTGPLERAIEKNPNGIGITGVSSARKLHDVKILKLAGKDPTYENIKDGGYLLYRPLYIVSSIDRPNPDVQRFINFVLSKDGRAVMRRVGTVPYEDAIALWLRYLDEQNGALVKH